MVQDLLKIVGNLRSELNGHTDMLLRNARSLAKDLGSFRNMLVVLVSLVWVLSIILDAWLKYKGVDSNFFPYATGAMGTVLAFYFYGRAVTDKMNGNGNGKRKDKDNEEKV